MKYILSLMAIVLMVGCNSKVEDKSGVDTSNIIIDNAYVVLDNDKFMQQYRDFNGHLIKEFDIDFRTITTSDDVDIDSYAHQEFTKLQQESRSQSGKAILMVVNTLQDKVRLEVSMALEPVYTDAFISYIERKGLVPYFRNNNIIDAIYVAAELISDRAYDASIGQEFMPPMESKSIGAGAKTKAHIGKTNYSEKKGDNVTASSSDTPMDVLKKYLNVDKTHNKNPNLNIYTDATKAFFANWTVTDINQNNEVRFLEPCMDTKKVKYASDGRYAVVMNDPVKDRTCSPYFFKKEQGKWKLDIATMAKVVLFNAEMQWHFNLDTRLKEEAMYYAFAFDGYMLDGNGYPHEVPAKRKKDPKIRWGYTCNGWYAPEDSAKYKQNPKKYTRCFLKYVWQGSPADIRLGLMGGDSIMAIGEGTRYKDKVSLREFMDYLNSLSRGEVATVFIRHYKEKNIIKLQGIAP